ncbi:MAG: AsmA-like C-terminal region-containing protein [bacterium]|nr:AsmA-like C-terminal region-containing protein [bacterium]
MLKKFLTFIIIIAIILIIGIIILPFITISSTNLTQFITRELEKNLARKVEIGEIRINILKGIEVKDVIVHNQKGFKSPSLLENKSLILRYRFLPLLKRQVIITEIILVEPAIFIERNKADKWNFKDLWLTKKTEDEGGKGGRFSLQLDKIVVKKGTLYFLDDALHKIKTSMERIDGQIDGLNKREGIVSFKVTAGKIGDRRTNFKLRGGLDLNLDLGLIEIVTTKLTLADLEAEVTGGLKDETINLELRSNEFSLANIAKLIPIPLHKLKVSGKGRINVGLSGRSDEKLQVLGVVTLTNGQIKYNGLKKPIKNLNLELQFSDTNLKLSSLTGEFGNSDFDIWAEIPNIKNPKVNLTFCSKKLILDEIIENSSELFTAKQPVDLDVEGKINVQKWAFREISGSDLYADFRCVRNVLMLRSLKTNAANGVLESSGTIDLSSELPEYSISVKANQLDMTDIIAGFKGNRKIARGKLSLDVDLKGMGFEINNLKENLEAAGAVELKEVRLKELKILDRLATFLSLDTIRNLDGCYILAAFNIADGIISTDDFELRSSLIRLLASGEISLDLDVDFKVTATFPGRLGKQIAKLGRFIPSLGDEKGRMGGVRFRIKGNFKDPNFSEKQEEIKEKAKSEINEKINQEKDKIKEKLEGKIEGKKEEIKEIISSQEEEIKEKVKEEVGEKVKGLFKKFF